MALDILTAALVVVALVLIARSERRTPTWLVVGAAVVAMLALDLRYGHFPIAPAP